MRVLLDSCNGTRVRRGLEAAGQDVAAVGDMGPDPGDQVVLARAFEDGRVLVPMDTDFGTLVVADHARTCRTGRQAAADPPRPLQPQLVAQAKAEGLTLVTRDARIAGYEVEVFKS